MREVFENLAEQAMVHVPGQTGLHTRAFSLEKFAELIVKECVESLWTEECYNSDLALEEFERNSAKIKKHFGVEE